MPLGYSPYSLGMLEEGFRRGGRASQILDSAIGRGVQQSQFDAQMSEQRRHAMRQEQLQRQAIEEQRKARQAQQRAGIFGPLINAGAGAASGAIIGGLAAGAAPAANAAGEATQAAISPPAPTGDLSAPSIGPSGGGSVGGVNLPPGTVPINTDGYSPPQYKPFAGGSTGRGALIGGALGALDSIGGGNTLGAAINMPAQTYGLERSAFNDTIDATNRLGTLGLGYSRLAEQERRNAEDEKIRREQQDRQDQRQQRGFDFNKGENFNRQVFESERAAENRKAAMERAKLRQNQPTVYGVGPGGPSVRGTDRVAVESAASDMRGKYPPKAAERQEPKKTSIPDDELESIGMAIQSASPDKQRDIAQQELNSYSQRGYSVGRLRRILREVYGLNLSPTPTQGSDNGL